MAPAIFEVIKRFDVQAKLDVDGEFFRLDQKFTFSSELLKKYASKESGIYQHDIDVNFKHSDYTLDVEIESDFLTNNMKLSLLALNQKTGHY